MALLAQKQQQPALPTLDKRKRTPRISEHFSSLALPDEVIDDYLVGLQVEGERCTSENNTISSRNENNDDDGSNDNDDDDNNDRNHEGYHSSQHEASAPKVQ